MSNVANDHLKKLGLKGRDKITGFEGVISSIGFDLYGCVQYALHPPALLDKQELPAGHWFDEKRIVVLDATPVMEQPTFEHIPGPAAKPSHSSLPTL